MDANGSRLEDQRLASTRGAMSAFATDLDRADLGRCLLPSRPFDLEGALELIALGKALGQLALFDGGSGSVQGVGASPECNDGPIALVGAGEVGRQLAGLPQQQHQDAGCHWIERARVTDAPGLVEPSHAADDVVARRARRFVEHEDAVDAHPSHTL